MGLGKEHKRMTKCETRVRKIEACGTLNPRRWEREALISGTPTWSADGSRPPLVEAATPPPLRLLQPGLALLRPT